MSSSRSSRIQSAALIISIAVLVLVFGIISDGQVVPENKKPLMTEEAAEKESNKTAKADIEQTAQEQTVELKKQQASQIEQLDQKANANIEKAEELIAQVDQSISKAGLHQATSSKTVSPENRNISRRLDKARDRLDRLR